MGFSRQEYCSGVPCLSPGDLPDPGIKPASLNVSCTGRQVFTTNATREVHLLQYQDFSQQGFPSPPAAIHLCLPGQRPCLQTPQGCSSNSASGLSCASRTANPPPNILAQPTWLFPLDCRSSPVPTNVFPGSFSDFILRNPGHNTRSRAAMDPETQTGVCLQTDRAGMWARYQNLPRELILLPLTHTQVTSVLLEVYFSIYFKIHILPQGAPST